MLTLKYIEENPEVTDAGYNLSEEISRFVDEAADGNEVVDEDFDEIAAFIEDNKSDFYEWKRECAEL